jgi:hypothetical protein
MLRIRRRPLAWMMGLVLLGMSARATATPIFEPNNTRAQATVLNPGTFVVNDSLNGTAGRADTLLGEFDPSYQTLIRTDDNSSPLGNGFASKLTGVPLRANGSAYFSITGAGDVNFTGNHAQSGQYYVQFDLYDASHNFFKTLPLEYEKVDPGMLDNIWIDPPLVPEPQRVGGTVDVTINNLVGPGTGDSLDYFWFSGMQPGQAFTATLTTSTFNALIAQFDALGNLLAQSNPLAGIQTFSGVADAQGRALLAVTGRADVNFKGEHVAAGTYTLAVVPTLVPEPGTAGLLAMGGTVTALAWRRRRKR